MTRKIKYVFEFDGASSLEFELSFDDKMKLIGSDKLTDAQWTKLEFNKCKNCPLDETKEFCPIAKNLHDVVEATKDKISYVKADISVFCPERTYHKKSDAQDGLLSLFGLVMATSGCPHLDWFRPLARFHLPFSTLEETMFRVLSQQLVRDFLDNEVEFNGPIAEIKKRYNSIEQVNLDFITRIQSYCDGDADANAIAALDLFAKLFSFENDSNFASLRKIFD